MAYTEGTTQSWGSRLSNSLKGLVFGLILIAISALLLFWNEGRAVKTAQALDEGAEQVIPVESNATVDPAMENQLVHMSGQAVTTETLTDSQFGLSLPAIALRRTVEYYQWVEQSESHEEKQMGGSTRTVTTYTYTRKWCDEPQNSANFKEPGHDNFIAYQVEDDTLYANQVQFGAFRLSPAQVRRVNKDRAVDLSQYTLAPTPGCHHFINGNVLTVSRAAFHPEQAPVYAPSYAPEGQPQYQQQPYQQQPYQQQPYQQQYQQQPYQQQPYQQPQYQQPQYQQATPAAPAPNIGDVRITWTYAAPQETLSLIAVQTGDTFRGYRAKSGYYVNLLNMGVLTPEQMFERAHFENKVYLWLLRAVGWLLMYIGLRSLFSVLSVLADVLPFLGNLVEAGLSIASFLLSFIISLLIIAVAWFWYRPMLSLALVGVAVVCYFLLRLRRKK